MFLGVIFLLDMHLDINFADCYSYLENRKQDFLCIVIDFTDGPKSTFVLILLFAYFICAIQVVFNKKKEFQWQRLSLFLRVGATRYV